MAKEPPPTTTAPLASRPKAKLPRLPPTHKIQKRPLLHPAISNPHTSSSTPKVIYISATTPFIATVKRVKALLSEISSRESTTTHQELRRLMNNGGDGVLRELEKEKGGKEREEVLMKGTGRAVERCLAVAGWFMGEEGGEKYAVVVRTGSVGAVDDVVSKEEGAEEEGSRVRRVSCLEVGVRLKG